MTVTTGDQNVRMWCIIFRCRCLFSSQLRVDLAAAYRIAAHYGWDEVSRDQCILTVLTSVLSNFKLIYNHITVRVPGDKEHFLINPFGLHFNEMTASSLVKIDLHGNIIDPGNTELGYNIAGFVIHSALHELEREDIKCVWHTHHPVTSASMRTALTCFNLP